MDVHLPSLADHGAYLTGFTPGLDIVSGLNIPRLTGVPVDLQ